MGRLLKRLLPEKARLYIRRTGRLRWITKARVLRTAGSDAWADKPLRKARYVLVDPEVDTFTYSLANLDELIEQLAILLDRPIEELNGYLSEALADPELGSKLARDVGWRVLFMKRRPPMPSHHIAAWIIIRVRKPSLVVETGILEGLGSRTMLRALQLNAEEGESGRLISFDVMPDSGKALVPERLRPLWEPVYEATPEALSGLGDCAVDFFVHDSLQAPDHLRSEVDAILPHMSPNAILMTLAGWTGVFDEVADLVGARHWTFHEQPDDHFYRGRTVSWMALPKDIADRLPT